MLYRAQSSIKTNNKKVYLFFFFSFPLSISYSNPLYTNTHTMKFLAVSSIALLLAQQALAIPAAGCVQTHISK